MPQFGRNGSTYRRIVGGFFVVLVWGMFLVRIALGLGPMHDPEGNQSPTSHYFFGAVAVSAMVAMWIVIVGRRGKIR